MFCFGDSPTYSTSKFAWPVIGSAPKPTRIRLSTSVSCIDVPGGSSSKRYLLTCLGDIPTFRPDRADSRDASVHTGAHLGGAPPSAAPDVRLELEPPVEVLCRRACRRKNGCFE